MASTRCVNSIIARVPGGGRSLPPSASGQSGIESPDPVSRTIPPQTMSTKTRATVATKKPGRRLGFTGNETADITRGTEEAGIANGPDPARVARPGPRRLLAHDRNGVEILRRRRRGCRPLQRAVLVQVRPRVRRRLLSAPETQQHVQHEYEHPYPENGRAQARHVIPDLEFRPVRIDAPRHPEHPHRVHRHEGEVHPDERKPEVHLTPEFVV